MSMVGSRPGSASGSGSSPGISGGSGSGICSRSIDGLCVGGGNDGTSVVGGQMNYLECLHYERMPIPVPIPIVPPPPQMHSEDEVEPAYATGKHKRAPTADQLDRQ